MESIHPHRSNPTLRCHDSRGISQRLRGEGTMTMGATFNRIIMVVALVLINVAGVWSPIAEAFPTGLAATATQTASAIIHSADQPTAKRDAPLSPVEQSDSSRPAIWFEENNLGRHGGMPTDMMTMFDNPATWETARRDIQVYIIRTSTIFKNAHTLNNTFFARRFIPLMRNSGIQIAIDATGATWMSYRGRRLADREVALIKHLLSMGAPIRYVLLQSVLSKPLISHGRKIDYPMAQRVQDVVDYANLIKSVDPSIKIGLIDALPTKGKNYQDPYREVASALRAQNITLDSINLDCPYSFAQRGRTITWNGVKAVEHFVTTDIGAHFGLIATSNIGGKESNRAFYHRVLDVPRQFHRIGGDPDHYLLMSWYPHPQYSIPDNAGAGRYPAMKTVAAFRRELQLLYH